MPRRCRPFFLFVGLTNASLCCHSIPLLTDANFFLTGLDSGLFPGLSSSIEIHDGFGDAQAR